MASADLAQRTREVTAGPGSRLRATIATAAPSAAKRAASPRRCRGDAPVTRATRPASASPHRRWTIVGPCSTLIIRGGTVVDGTGAPGRRRRRRDQRRPHRGDRRDRRQADSHDRRRREGRRARLRRHPHALRRAGVLGHDADRRRRCTASRPSSAATAASRSRRSAASTATTSCACWPGSRACRSTRSQPACRGTGRRSASTSTASTARSAPNAGFLVGHSTIRRVVMGDDAATQGHATADDLDAMARAARAEPRGGRARLLVVVGAHAQRRRRRHGAVALRDRGRDRRAVPGRRASTRDHARVHPVRRQVRGLRRRPDGAHVARGEPAAQLERAVRVGRATRRWPSTTSPASDYAAAHGGRVLALTMPDRAVAADLLRQRLPPRHDPGLGRSRWRSRTTRRRRCSRQPDGRRRAAGGGQRRARVSSGSPTGRST